MSEREQINRQAGVDKKAAAQEAEQLADQDAEVQAAQAKEQRDLSDLDDLLDEIDAVLEENAAEFVAAYVQKGGE